MSYVVDLNCDMGESFGRYQLGYDEEVLNYITSSNIACGYHAGDPMVIDKTVSMAGEKGVGIGAHPSFPDLQGFGRRNMDLTDEEVKNFMIYQIGAIKIFTELYGYELQHVKPHGTLNTMSVNNRKLADALAHSIEVLDKELIFMTLAGSQTYYAAKEKGLKVASEFLADRNYNNDGSVVSRREPNAIIHDEEVSLKRTIRAIKEGVVEAIDGSLIEMKVDTVCLHGDNPGALQFARIIKEGLENEGIQIKPLGEFL